MQGIKEKPARFTRNCAAASQAVQAPITYPFDGSLRERRTPVHLVAIQLVLREITHQKSRATDGEIVNETTGSNIGAKCLKVPKVDDRSATKVWLHSYWLQQLIQIASNCNHFYSWTIESYILSLKAH